MAQGADHCFLPSAHWAEATSCDTGSPALPLIVSRSAVRAREAARASISVLQSLQAPGVH